MKVGSRVADTWWPWYQGVLIRITKKFHVVKWNTGPENGINIWKYDRAHLKYLRELA